MKKLLLATTAIAGIAFAAPAVIADEATDSPVVANPHFKVSLSGEARFQINWTDSKIIRQTDIGAIANNASSTQGRGYEFAMDEAELHVKADAVSDFGLKYGLKFELLAGRDDTNEVDEAMVYFAGTWGRIELGDEDDAADTLAVGGEDVMAGFGGYDAFGARNANDMYNFGQDVGSTGDLAGTVGVFGQAGDQVMRGPSVSPLFDSTKITYYTPSIYGFTFGVSFTPDEGHNGDAGLNDDNGNFENVTSLGLEYKRDFGKLGLTLAGVYVTGGSENGTTLANVAVNGDAIEDLKAYQIGTKLSYAGFELAGAFADFAESGLTKVDAQNGADSGQWWDVGLSYATGPWKFSTGYFHFDRKLDPTDQTAGVSNEVENEIISVSTTYNLAPGLALKGDINFIDNSYVNDTVAPNVNTKNDGTVFLIGTQVKF